MKYHFDTNKIFSIWFNKQSANEPLNHHFLPFLNQKRLITLVKNNFHAQVTFIYCSESLSEKGLRSLLSFCDVHKIIPLDLMAIIDTLKHQMQNLSAHKDNAELIQMDFNLCLFALREIRKANQDDGGNLAVASDIVRLLNVSIEQGGIYCDFDVNLSLSPIADGIEYDGMPFICYGTPRNLQGIPEYSNEFLAFASEKGKLCGASRLILLSLKKNMLETFKGKPKQLLDKILSAIDTNALNALIKFFKLDFESVHSISDFRKMLQSIDSFEKMAAVYHHRVGRTQSEMVEDFYPSLKMYADCPRMTATSKEGLVKTILLDLVYGIYVNTVVNLSGPLVLHNIVDDSMHFSPCLHSVTGFKDYVRGTNLGEAPSINYTIKQKQLSFRNDASWTPEGAMHLNMSSQNLAAHSIQNAWRAYRSKPSV